MAYNRKLLNDNEDVVLDLNPHWWYMSHPTIALVAAFAFGIFALTTDTGFLQVLAGVLLLGALGWWGARFAKWRTINFVVTTDRLIYRSGVFAKQGIEIPLDRVNNVIFNQSVFERILGAGDLTIESAGESGSSKYYDIRKPSAVQTEIYRQIEANENRKFDRISAGANRGGGPSLADELGKLDDLRARGVISEEEFVAQKSRLLGGG